MTSKSMESMESMYVKTKKVSHYVKYITLSKIRHDVNKYVVTSNIVQYVKRKGLNTPQP